MDKQMKRSKIILGIILVTIPFIALAVFAILMGQGQIIAIVYGAIGIIVCAAVGVNLVVSNL